MELSVSGTLLVNASTQLVEMIPKVGVTPNGSLAFDSLLLSRFLLLSVVDGTSWSKSGT